MTPDQIKARILAKHMPNIRGMVRTVTSAIEEEIEGGKGMESIFSIPLEGVPIPIVRDELIAWLGRLGWDASVREVGSGVVIDVQVANKGPEPKSEPTSKEGADLMADFLSYAHSMKGSEL